MELLRQSLISSATPYKEGAVAVFEQKFNVKVDGKITITALGVYEAEIDGVKLGDQLFAPGFTYYPTHLYYQEYDLSSLVEGEHTLRVYLGQGWYSGRFTFDNKTKIYGDEAAVTWVIEADGIYTSRDSSVRELESPWEYAGFYDGEIFTSKKLKEIGRPKQPGATLPDILEKTTSAVRIREEMPIKAIAVSGGKTIIDFGQNFAGIISIDPRKMHGRRLKIRHGEILNKDGSLYTSNLRRAKAEIVYEKGEVGEIYRPRFTYMGFRYAELSGVPYEEGLISAHAIFSDMERTGDFTCENPLVDKLFKNQVWGQKSNYVELPTDCPQRDERMGYTGDGHVFAKTGAYNFDTLSFWKKFLRDVKHSQDANKEGYVAPTIPAPPGERGIGFMSMLGWGNMICILPEMIYHHFGDKSVLTEYYDAMKKFVECEMRKMGGLLGKPNLWIAPSLGDWLAMGRDVKFMAIHNGPVSNAFIVNDLRIMVWAAELLGKANDLNRYKKQLEKTRRAYLRTFVKKDGGMKDDYQGAYVMALRMVIPKGELWNKVYNRLKEKVIADGMQTGFFATEHILPLFAENGDEKLAFDLLLDERLGGWLYQVKAGATTTWERWDALRPDGSVNETKMSKDNMVSFNHYSFGSVGRFYYEHILGITPLEDGFKKVQIAPKIDKRLGAFSGHFKGIFVKYENNSLHISTDTNTKIVLPDGREFEKCAGEYKFDL